MIITLDHVRNALTLSDFDPQRAQAQMAPHPRPIRRPERPDSPKLAGVLVLLYPLPNRNGEAELHFALMKRTEYPGVHSGQISLPGGRREGDETFEQTALRETAEELGAPADQIEIIGALGSLYVPPSDFEIYPTVGYTSARPQWRPDPSEVAEILEVPLNLLIDDSVKGHETREVAGNKLQIGYYLVSAHKVWGATAAMLSEFEQRLRTVLGLTHDREHPIRA